MRSDLKSVVFNVVCVVSRRLVSINQLRVHSNICNGFVIRGWQWIKAESGSNEWESGNCVRWDFLWRLLEAEMLSGIGMSTEHKANEHKYIKPCHAIPYTLTKAIQIKPANLLHYLMSFVYALPFCLTDAFLHSLVALFCSTNNVSHIFVPNENIR